MTIYKTFKYKLYPTRNQRKSLDRVIDGCRLFYNQILSIRKSSWELEKKSIKSYDIYNMIPILKGENDYLENIYSQVLRNVVDRVDFSYQRFFNRVKQNENPGYPRFKGFGRYDSFTFPQNRKGFRLREGKLSLFKIGKIKINIHRPIEGEVKSLTVRRDKIGNFYACFVSNCNKKFIEPVFRSIGIDLGLTKFATFSNGEEIKREYWIKLEEKELSKIQRKISKLEKHSIERKKYIRKLNHVYSRIRNKRINFSHQESKKVVNKFDLIVLEKLDILSMQNNGNKILNKGISDVTWNQFIQHVQYKAEEAGRGFVLVDPRNTSQECSQCHEIVKKDLSVRIHNCPNCGLVLDRDHNAAINILARGLASIGNQSVKALSLRE